jgi:hypothetical protein
MNLSSIRYGRNIIKVEFKKLKKYDGYFETKKHLLVIDKTIKGNKLFNTIIHEIFHIIMYFEKINFKFEEPIAIAVGNGFTKIFKQNPKLFKQLYKLI